MPYRFTITEEPERGEYSFERWVVIDDERQTIWYFADGTRPYGAKKAGGRWFGGWYGGQRSAPLATNALVLGVGGEDGLLRLLDSDECVLYAPDGRAVALLSPGGPSKARGADWVDERGAVKVVRRYISARRAQRLLGSAAGL